MGGGGGGSTQFKAQGAPPSYDYLSSAGLQQLAVGGDIQSYALSDQDFANRYPALQSAYNQYQANLGQQVGQVAQGQTGQAGIMQGLANTIAGRQGMGTTSDINAIRNAAATAGTATQPIFNMGAQQAGLAAPLTGVAQQQGQIGGQLNRLGQNITGMAQSPYAMGQQLLQEPIDPLTQQQMMRSGLTSAAGAMGAASLGQGMAGQAAAARQLGMNTLQYGQAMRGEAMQDIGLAASIAGQGGQMSGLGANVLGGAGQTLGLAGGQLQGAGGLYNLGAQTAGLAGGLSGQAQQAQETMGMNTAQMAGIYGTMQNQQATNMMANIASTGQLFQKRAFGLGGTNMAQAELGQAGSYNNFQAANYATMNGIAFNQAQLNAQNQQLQAQQQAGLVSAGIGAGTTAATTGAMAAAMACWVARAVYGTRTNRWKHFRHWLLHQAPRTLRTLYVRHGEAFAERVRRSSVLRWAVRTTMNYIISKSVYVSSINA